MLQEANAGVLRQDLHHVIEYSADCKEALGCSTNVIETALQQHLWKSYQGS